MGDIQNRRETITFKIDSEWLCNFVRQRVFYEGVEFARGLELLKASFSGLDDETALAILTGTKKVVGINGGEVVDDNQMKLYLDYVAREEKKKKKLEIEQDISIHPLNYFDPFAAKWSYREFREDTIDQGRYPTLRGMYDYFTEPPADQESDPLMLGGMYSVDANFVTKPIRSGEDQEEFYEGLYKYWEDYVKENEEDLSSLEKRRIELRQRAYRLHKNKEKERDERLNRLLSKVKLEEAEKKLEEEKGLNIQVGL